MPLTPRRSRFVREYLLDLNATRAAERAGYKPTAAERMGHRLVHDPEVHAAIAAAEAEAAHEAGASAVEVIRELRRLATSDVGGLFGAAGQPLPLASLPVELRRAVSSVEFAPVPQPGRECDDGASTPATTVLRVSKVRMWDKPKALELLGKHLQLYAERVEHTGADGGALTVVIHEAGKP